MPEPEPRLVGKSFPLLAFAFATIAAALSAVDAVIVRLLADDVHPFVIGFFRSLCGLMTILPWIALRPQILRTRYRLRHASRAALKLLSLVCGFAAFAAAPLADVTAIMFTAPVFVIIGAWLMLGERLTIARILAVLAAFAGTMVIIAPGGEGGASIALLLAVTGAALQALVQLMLKRMSDRDSVETLVAWNLIVTVPIAAIPAFFVWETPGLRDCGLLVLQGALGAVNMSLMTKAFSLADASHVAPVDFLRLPFVAIASWLIFGEIAGLRTWSGAILILLATMLPVAGGLIRRRRR
ncbi:DMT family transporter [Rhizobium puerariae]|uniref:DMT family transporter n=1 Tax=Rhizobium puerariae TaxID=1585791 RepID=A0ABV6AF05_9HYPH